MSWSKQTQTRDPESNVLAKHRMRAAPTSIGPPVNREFLIIRSAKRRVYAIQNRGYLCEFTFVYDENDQTFRHKTKDDTLDQFFRDLNHDTSNDEWFGIQYAENRNQIQALHRPKSYGSKTTSLQSFHVTRKIVLTSTPIASPTTKAAYLHDTERLHAWCNDNWHVVLKPMGQYSGNHQKGYATFDLTATDKWTDADVVAKFAL